MIVDIIQDTGITIWLQNEFNALLFKTNLFKSVKTNQKNG